MLKFAEAVGFATVLGSCVLSGGSVDLDPGLNSATETRRAGQRALTVSPPCFEAAAWHEADQLFLQDPHWVGADGAYSIDLGADRILWLFADTWIDPSGQHERRGARMIRNSIAIQTGSDPSNASIEYYWGTTTDDEPEALFRRQDDRWYWPGHGVRVDDRLLLFFNRLRGSDTGLGFESDGWNAAMVMNPDDEPSRWDVEFLETPSTQQEIIIGFASVLRWENHIYAFGPLDPVKYHPIYVARWTIEEVRLGDMLAPEWWAGRDIGWLPETSSPPRLPIFENGQSELTIHFDESTQHFLSVQSKGFGQADVFLRVSPALTGPWSKGRMIYRPPEYYRPNIMIYAAKAHPHLTGADLALTYATNTFEFSEHLTDDLIYYPRFVRLTRCE